MAAALEQLLRDLDRALKSGDPDRITSVRVTIAQGHPESDAGAEANYRLGLSALFSGQDLEQAATFLKAATKAKSKAWGPDARTSFGLVLFRLGKVQQAIFELRKVAGVKPPTLASARALGFMVMLLREGEKRDEADRTRKQQFEALRALTKSADAEVQAQAHFMLGMEHKHDGDRAGAKENLQNAVESEALGPDELAIARAALKAV